MKRTDFKNMPLLFGCLSEDFSACHSATMADVCNDSSSIQRSDDGLFSVGTHKALPSLRQSIGGVTAVIDGVLFSSAGVSCCAGVNSKEIAEKLVSTYNRAGFKALINGLNGEYNIALYDDRKRKLYLGRDRVGTRPLNYAITGKSLLFSSRLLNLIAVPGVSRAVNRQHVATYAGHHYRMFDNTHIDTPFESINAIPPGHFGEFSINATIEAKLERYWSPNLESLFDSDFGKSAQDYRALLLDAVSSRVAQGSRPGFSLSGGMDSSSVLGCAVYDQKAPQEVYSVTYEDPLFDESVDIKTMQQFAAEPWHRIDIGNDIDILNGIDEMVLALEEPSITATWFAFHILAKTASENGIDTLLGGLGGDELNAGEYEYFPYFFADVRRDGDLKRLDQEIRCWAKFHDHPIFKKDAELGYGLIGQLTDPAHPGRCLVDENRFRRYEGTVSKDYFDLSGVTAVMEHPYQSHLANRCFQDLTRETLHPSARMQERLASYNGMMNLNPFLDNRLIDRMFCVPAQWQIRNGQTKILLRKSMRGIVPDEVLERVTKRGWNAPAHIWFNGNTMKRLKERVLDPANPINEIYNIDRVETIMKEHEDIVSNGLNVENHMMFLWQLANLDSWHRFVSGIDAQIYKRRPAA